MPGNLVVINNQLTWYVGDSKMEELIEHLDKVGMREANKEHSTIFHTDYCEECDKLRILSIEER